MRKKRLHLSATDPAVCHRGIAVTFRGSCFHRVRLLPQGEARMRKGFFVYVGSDITRSCRIRSVSDGEERISSLPIRHNQSDAKKANNSSQGLNRATLVSGGSVSAMLFHRQVCLQI